MKKRKPFLQTSAYPFAAIIFAIPALGAISMYIEAIQALMTYTYYGWKYGMHLYLVVLTVLYMVAGLLIFKFRKDLWERIFFLEIAILPYFVLLFPFFMS